VAQPRHRVAQAVRVLEKTLLEAVEVEGNMIDLPMDWHLLVTNEEAFRVTYNGQRTGPLMAILRVSVDEGGCWGILHTHKNKSVPMTTDDYLVSMRLGDVAQLMKTAVQNAARR
jgi:hypothetical protein